MRGCILFHPGFTILILAMALVALGGCQTTETAQGPANGSRQAESGEPINIWPFWPRRMRIHPLTRIAEASLDQSCIELRLEFTDADGVETRAVGDLIVKYFSAGSRTPTQPTQQWQIDLRTLDANALYYDRVTRTYLLRLEIEGAEISEGSLVHAEFTGVDGWEFSARHDLRR